MKTKANVSHDEVMVKKLRKSPTFAAEYLKAAIQDAEQPRVLLIALRQIAEARGGIAKIAKAAGIERESLYRAPIAARQSAPLDVVRRNEGHGPNAHSRARPPGGHLTVDAKAKVDI